MFVRIEDKNLISRENPINEPDNTGNDDEIAYETERSDDKNNRIQMLEQKVENLYAELNELRKQFLEFKKEFI
jgi:hypothetical protein